MTSSQRRFAEICRRVEHAVSKRATVRSEALLADLETSFRRVANAEVGFAGTVSCESLTDKVDDLRFCWRGTVDQFALNFGFLPREDLKRLEFHIDRTGDTRRRRKA